MKGITAVAVLSAVVLAVGLPAMGQPVRFQVASSPTVDVPGELSAVDVLNRSTAWAVGDAGGRALAERWDGRAWRVVPAVTPGDTSGLLGITTIAEDDAWAVGAYDQDSRHHTLIEHWNGSGWTRASTLGNRDLNAVDAVASDDVWAVGVGPLIMHWVGQGWGAVPWPSVIEEGELHAVKAFAADDIWAVGGREVEQGNEVHDIALLLHWDGQLWNLVVNPATRSDSQELWALGGTSGSDVWAVGEQDTDQGGKVIAMHFDGTEWAVIPAPSPGAAENELTGLVALGSDDVWAVGGQNDGTAEHPLVEHWNGKAWRVVTAEDAPGSPAADALLAVAGTSHRDLWAVGLQGPSDGELQPLVEYPSRTG